MHPLAQTKKVYNTRSATTVDASIACSIAGADGCVRVKLLALATLTTVRNLPGVLIVKMKSEQYEKLINILAKHKHNNKYLWHIKLFYSVAV